MEIFFEKLQSIKNEDIRKNFISIYNECLKLNPTIGDRINILIKINTPKDNDIKLPFTFDFENMKITKIRAKSIDKQNKKIFKIFSFIFENKNELEIEASKAFLALEEYYNKYICVIESLFNTPLLKQLIGEEALLIPDIKINKEKKIAKINIRCNRMGLEIVKKGRECLGILYSWGGGNKDGPTTGKIQNIDPYADDTKVEGFDCASLCIYCVYQATGVELPFGSWIIYEKVLRENKKYKNDEIKPGDLVFYYSTQTGRVGHVAIYSGNGKMIEAHGHTPDKVPLPIHETEFRRNEKLKEYVGRFYL